MYISGNGDIYDDEEVIITNSRSDNTFEEFDDYELMDSYELVLKWEKSLNLRF